MLLVTLNQSFVNDIGILTVLPRKGKIIAPTQIVLSPKRETIRRSCWEKKKPNNQEPINMPSSTMAFFSTAAFAVLHSRQPHKSKHTVIPRVQQLSELFCEQEIE